MPLAGKAIMRITHEQMIKVVQYWWSDRATMHAANATVTKVSQIRHGTDFVIEFNDEPGGGSTHD